MEPISVQDFSFNVSKEEFQDLLSKVCESLEICFFSENYLSSLSYHREDSRKEQVTKDGRGPVMVRDILGIRIVYSRAKSISEHDWPRFIIKSKQGSVPEGYDIP